MIATKIKTCFSKKSAPGSSHTEKNRIRHTGYVNTLGFQLRRVGFITFNTSAKTRQSYHKLAQVQRSDVVGVARVRVCVLLSSVFATGSDLGGKTWNRRSP